MDGEAEGDAAGDDATGLGESEVTSGPRGVHPTAARIATMIASPLAADVVFKLVSVALNVRPCYAVTNRLRRRLHS
jgi:hypothetical protein